ncbi:MAG: hypothetical protein IPM54_26260 [Polyangiaceae bacterium]|nr:hypothetical protein [Polyangiaceae bacterium]
MKREEITSGASLEGVEPSLTRADEPSLREVTAARSWSSQLTAEAKRVDFEIKALKERVERV